MSNGADRADYSEYAARLVGEIYSQATEIVLEQIARRLAAGITDPGWAEVKLSQLAELQGGIQLVIARLNSRGAKQAAALAQQAYTLGLRGEAKILGTSTLAVEALADDMAGRLEAAAPRILRWAVDVYRDVIGQAVGTTASGVLARRAAAQLALDQFAARGVTGFVDARGRAWALETYAEMAVRTGTMNAHLMGTRTRLAQQGYDLVIVSGGGAACPLCLPWIDVVMSNTGSTPGYPSVGEATASGLFHANCFPGGVRVSAPHGVDAADSRWYDGELVVIHTAGGDELPVTPNHPVLTPEGWVSAGALMVGQHVMRYRPEVQRVDLVRPDDKQVEASISETFEALRQREGVLSVSVPASAEQFHGDGGNADVHVVLSDRLLQGHGQAELANAHSHGPLFGRGHALGALLAESPLVQVGVGSLGAEHSLVGGGNLGGALLGGHASPLAGFGFAAADLGTANLDPPVDAGLMKAESGRELCLALAGLVAPDQIVNIGRRKFAGHVYNLQTPDGWYTASGIMVHNCRHGLDFYSPGLTSPPDTQKQPERYVAQQRQRAIERRIRANKRRLAAARPFGATPETARAARLVTRAQADMRELVARYGLPRQWAREQIGKAR